MAPPITNDLARLESKIDKMQEAIVSLARVEERTITLFKRLDNLDQRTEKHDQRLDKLELSSVGRGQFFTWLERFGVAIVGGAVALGFGYYK